jgi:two-component system cell cycle sensor histidine kinase PleC
MNSGSGPAASILSFDALFRLTTDAVVIADAAEIDPPGPRIVYVNPAFTRLTGYRPEDIIGQTPRIFQGPKTDRAGLDRIRRALEQNQPVQVDLYNYGKDGREYWVDMSITPLHDPTGASRWFLGIQRDITERKRTETELHRTRFALESAVDPAIWTRPDGSIRYVNDAACRALGYSRADLLALSVANIAALGRGAEFGQLWATFWRRLKQAGAMTAETRLRRIDGTTFPVEVTASYLQMNGEEMNCAFARDITQRRRVEEQLRETEARLTEALDSIAEGFTLWDENQRLVLCNERYREIFAPSAALIRPGISFETLLRAHVANGCYTVTGDVEAWMRDRIERRSRARSDLEVEISAGRRFRISEHKTPRGFTVTVWIDITELKRAEQRLRDAIESVNEGFALWDADEILVLCNSRYRDHSRFLREKPAPGIGFSHLLRRRVETGEYRIDTASEVWIAERLDLFRLGGAFEQELADGRWLLGSYRCTSDGGTVGIETDITLLKLQELQLKVSEDQLRQNVEELEDARERLEGQATVLSELAGRYMAARDAAETASQAKSQFLAMMSHELRTPLNAIIGFSEMIETQALGPVGVPKYVEYAGDVSASGRHLLELINNILEMSKIEAGKYVIRREPLDIAEIIRYCLRMVRLRADEAGIALVEHIAADLPTISADERALRQILLNLLSNAIKFTDKGGTVTVMAMADAKTLNVVVGDTGIGIAPDDLARIGRPFEQIDNRHSRRYDGTGLGLALTRSLIELHGGRMTIESEVQVGTRITMILPLMERKASVWRLRSGQVFASSSKI